MWLSNHHTWGEGRGYRREALAHLLIEFCSFDPGLGFCEARGSSVCFPGGLPLSIHGHWVYTDIAVSSSLLPSHSAKFSILTFLLPFPEVNVTLRRFPGQFQNRDVRKRERN